MANIEDNRQNSVDNGKKVKLVVKIIAILGVGVACIFGCCDAECLLYNFNAFFGL